MKISLVSDNITVIELSPEEMTQYDFTFEKSDYSSPHTRRALWSIIDDASRIIGKQVQVSKGLEIDLLPDIKGGALLIISQGEKEKPKHDSHIGVFQTDDINQIIDFAMSTKKSKKDNNSSLYKSGESYRLIIKGIDNTVRYLAMEFYLNECHEPYCDKSTVELWDCLIEKNALEILSGTAS